MLRTPIPCLLAFLLFLSGIATAQSPAHARVALVIGNARYESSIGALRNSVNDAKAVSKTLRSLGFHVIEKHNVSRNELLAAVDSFRTKLADTEVALFYFAGHGISVEGANYLIPIKSGYAPEGGDLTSLRILAETKLFNAEQVVAEMGVAGSRCNLVILDACRNTPIARNPAARDASRGTGLVEMKPPAGSLIAFATDAGHTASDGTGKNGLYTGELIENLATPGLTIEQVFKRTRARVMEKSNGAQVPAEYSRLVGDDIFLAGIARAQSAGPDAPKAAPVAPPGPAAINHLAATGQVRACIDALHLTAATQGPGNFAATPLDTLLDRAKDQLKSATAPSPPVESAMETCRLVLAALPECLPASHARYNELTAKANNRLGDCLMIYGKPQDALALYQIAVGLSPHDPYPVYNRGRAHLAAGDKDAARADFTTAASPKFSQSGARKLAQTALKELQ